MVNSGTAASSRKTTVDGDIGRQWSILAETMVNSGTAASSRKTMVDGDIGRQWPILAERQWSTLAAR